LLILQVLSIFCGVSITTRQRHDLTPLALCLNWWESWLLHLPSLPLSFQIINKCLYLHGLSTWRYPCIYLLLCNMTLLQHILYGLYLKLPFLLIMLVAEFLPLVWNSLLWKWF
jgi:hypothetical protein